MTTPPVTIHTTTTDLVVAAALADVRGLTPLADRLEQAAREAEKQRPTRLTDQQEGEIGGHNAPDTTTPGR